MKRAVIGYRQPDGGTRLVLVLPSGMETPLTARANMVPGWDGCYDWGCRGPRAVGTALTMLAALGLPLASAMTWLDRFVADWIVPGTNSRIGCTSDELAEWLRREAAKDLTSLVQGGAGQGE